MKWDIHIYDPKSGATTTHVKDYPGTSASMADAPAVVAKASRDFHKHMKYILAVPHRKANRQHATKKSPTQLKREIAEILAHKGNRHHSTISDDAKIRDAIARFPPTFGLRGFPGVVFRLSPTSSYVSGGSVMLYTQRKEGDHWLDFSKGTEPALRGEIVSLPSAGGRTKGARLGRAHSSMKAAAKRDAYQLQLTIGEMLTAKHALGHYAWPNMLLRHVSTDGRVVFTEAEMQQWRVDADKDRYPFPMAPGTARAVGNPLANKLLDFYHEAD